MFDLFIFLGLLILTYIQDKSCLWYVLWNLYTIDKLIRLKKSSIHISYFRLRWKKICVIINFI